MLLVTVLSGAVALFIHRPVGNDVRKLVEDGFPSERIIAIDLRSGESDRTTVSPLIERNIEFWDLGHRLFNSTPETRNARPIMESSLSVQLECAIILKVY